MALSSSQPWKLSQSANKSSGICSVCKATRQLHLKDGLIHLHGPLTRRCLGSDKPPLDPSGAISAPLAAQGPSGSVSSPVIVQPLGPSLSAGSSGLNTVPGLSAVSGLSTVPGLSTVSGLN